MSLKLNAAQQRQFRILDQSVNSSRDSNGSRGKARGRGRGRGGRTTTTQSQDNSQVVATARQVAKHLFAAYNLRREENDSIWSIGDIDQVRGLAQINVKQNRVDVNSHVDRLHGTIFDYRAKKIVALNLGSIPRAVVNEKLDIDSESGMANFVINGKTVTYHFDLKDGLVIEPGYEGILCVLYKHGEDYLIGNRTRINLGNGYVGESRRYSEMLESLIPEPGNWFQGLSDTTVFYFMLVAGDLLVGSRQYVPEDLEYIVYLGKRDMADLSEISSEIPPWLTSDDNPNRIVNGRVYSRIQRPDIFPVQRFNNIDAANDFLINGYEGQQRATRSGWLNQPKNGPSKPYIRLFPSTFVNHFCTDNIPQIARTIFDRYIDKSTISPNELQRFDEFLRSKNMTDDDQGVTEAYVDPIMIDVEHMPDWYDHVFETPTLKTLHKFVCAADMASVDFIDEKCGDIDDVQPKLRNSESVVVYMCDSRSGTPRYSLVHVFSAGMHYRQSIFEESQNRLLTSYLSLYQKICYGKIELPRDFYVNAIYDENYRFDVLTMNEAEPREISPSLLAKIVIRDSLPEGRQRIRIEEFDNSIITSVESFIVARSRNIVQERRKTPLKNNSDPEVMERRIGGLVAIYRERKSALFNELSSMDFLDVIELYRYINSIYLNFKSEVL